MTIFIEDRKRVSCLLYWRNPKEINVEVYFSQFSASALMLAVIMINNVDKFLKKLWCCDGGGGGRAEYNYIIWFELATIKTF